MSWGSPILREYSETCDMGTTAPQFRANRDPLVSFGTEAAVVPGYAARISLRSESSTCGEYRGYGVDDLPCAAGEV